MARSKCLASLYLLFVSVKPLGRVLLADMDRVQEDDPMFIRVWQNEGNTTASAGWEKGKRQEEG